MEEIKIPSGKTLEQIVSLISGQIGINFMETHKKSLGRFIEKRILELGASCEEYLALAKGSRQELDLLINAATVNETYFFREEKQFDLVKTIICAKNKVDGCGKIDLWSAACSSGDEIYSLKLLCDSVGVDADFFASDVNTKSLCALRNGLFGNRQGIREIDGKSYHDLLAPYIEGEKVCFPEKIRSCIHSSRINLIDFDDYKVLNGRKFDIVFLRNVFIYFSAENKYRILNFIAQNHLKEDGYIFVSLSEIAQIEERNLSENLEKICMDDVFLFHKKKTLVAAEV